jgi:hypothetical protein
VIRRTLLAVVAVLTLSVIAAAPAQAHFQWGCNHGSACVFTDYNGSGGKFTIIWSSNPKNTCLNLPSNFQDRSGSLVSDFGNGWDVYWYENADCSDLWGADRLNSPGHWSLDATRTHLDDDVQSFKIIQ